MSEIQRARGKGKEVPEIDQRRESFGRTLFLADWLEAVFMHYGVRAEALRGHVPFPLDVYEGDAWVSLVAFTMHRLRPAFGGSLSETLFQPLSPCRFLNLRTYVKVKGEAGIYFMGEWISNALSVPLGRVSFGLPYRMARIEYAQAGTERTGLVSAPGGGTALRFRGVSSGGEALAPSHEGTLDAFLHERYSAFTQWGGMAATVSHRASALVTAAAADGDRGRRLFADNRGVVPGGGTRRRALLSWGAGGENQLAGGDLRRAVSLDSRRIAFITGGFLTL